MVRADGAPEQPRSVVEGDTVGVNTPFCVTFLRAERERAKEGSSSCLREAGCGRISLDSHGG